MAENLFSKLSFAKKTFDSTGPDWRSVSQGLNIEGRCQNHSCKAYNQDVWIPKGILEDTGGRCTFNTEVKNLKCPICSQKIDSNTVCGLGIFECKIEISASSTDSFKYTEYKHTDTTGYIANISPL